jgi:acetoin utilization protein AcuB
MDEEHQVRDFMTTQPKSLSQSASLLDAVLLFRSSHSRHLPVVDGHRVVGIISERDVQRLSPSLLISNVSSDEYNNVLENTALKQVMIRNPLTVSAETPLQEAAAILKDEKVGCLPVVRDGNLIGIITVIDMLNALIFILDGKARIGS